ncbi:MAG: 50S ribosomal protein L10 [Patescibacteria group bacterium]|nr:MAG: 50S ribosomal protein L10 [Patescibacteria group bacterium]
MAITKDKKREVIEGVQNAASSSDSLVFVNFHGLNVVDTTTLRKELRDKGISYMVAKKTLIKRALHDSKLEGDMPELDGELALAYGDDLLAPAREVFNFQKLHKDSVAILGGIFEGRYMDKAEMTSIATIPPAPVLYGQFVNLINSPIQRFAVVLNEIAKMREA